MHDFYLQLRLTHLLGTPKGFRVLDPEPFRFYFIGAGKRTRTPNMLITIQLRAFIVVYKCLGSFLFFPYSLVLQAYVIYWLVVFSMELSDPLGTQTSH